MAQKRNRPDRDGADKSKVTKVKRWMRSHEMPCSICGLPINYDLKHPNPWSFTVDHIIPIDAGGTSDIDNLAPAHRRCNLIKGTTGITLEQINKLRLEQGCTEMVTEPPAADKTALKRNLDPQKEQERIEKAELLEAIAEHGVHPESDYCHYIGGGYGLRPDKVGEMWTEDEAQRWTVNGIEPIPIDKLS